MAPDDTSAEVRRLCEEADDLLRLGRPDEALRRLNFALDSLRNSENPGAEAAVLEAFARVYQATGQMDKAEQSTRAALACWMKVEDRAEEARMLGLLASLRISQGDVVDGEFWLQSSLQVLRESGSHTGEAEILRSLGALHLRKGELSPAEDYARQAIELFARADDKVGEARAQGTYAQMLMRHHAYAEAYAAATRCQKLFEQAGHKQGASSGMQVRAAIMRRQGRLAEAEKLLNEVVAQKHELNDVAGEAAVMNTLGLVLLDGGERLDDAERCILRSIELFNSVNDSQNAALAQQNLADIYVERGRPGDAELVLRDALKIHERTGGIESCARTMNGIAGALQSQGRIDEALKAYEESVELARRVRDHGLVVKMLCPWGVLRAMLGEGDQAAAALEDALAQEHPGDDAILRHVLPLRIRIALARGDVETGEEILAQAQEQLSKELPDVRGSFDPYLRSVQAARNGQMLYHGFIPSTIETPLRRALIRRLKETDPKGYGNLDMSIREAMER